MKSDTRIIHKNVSIEDPKYWDSDLWFYLKEVIMQYEALGFDINSGKPVLVKYMKDGPMCSNRGIYRVIFLSATEAYWCQYMYQFAHEFCHHLINGPMDGNYVSSFWFEESVCEMASEYFLMKIAKEWIENDTKYGKLGATNSILNCICYIANYRFIDYNHYNPACFSHYLLFVTIQNKWFSCKVCWWMSFLLYIGRNILFKSSA